MPSIYTTLALTFLLTLATSAHANHQEFVWDANVEPDMKEYRVYTCPALPCSKLNGTLFAVVQHPTTNVVISHGTEGEAFVTALDTSGNESAESNVAVYDAKPPFGPKNFKFQRK